MRLRSYLLMLVALMCAACLPTDMQDRVSYRSPLGTPTPTRSDETVIPFEMLAANQIFEIPPEFGGESEPMSEIPPKFSGKPPAYTYFTPSVEYEVWQKAYNDPPIMLITAVDDLAPIQVWIAPEIQMLLDETDFTQQAVFFFFPTDCGGGYVQRIATSQPDSLTVYAVVRRCAMTTADEKRPYQVVRFDRADVPFEITPETEVNLEITVY